MHVLKLVLLMLMLLAIMRAISWILSWPFARLWPRRRMLVAAAGNLAGLAAFIAFLIWDTSPGEPMNDEAAIFGVVVYFLYALSDLLWHPFIKRRPAAATG